MALDCLKESWRRDHVHLAEDHVQREDWILGMFLAVLMSITPVLLNQSRGNRTDAWMLEYATPCRSIPIKWPTMGILLSTAGGSRGSGFRRSQMAYARIPSTPSRRRRPRAIMILDARSVYVKNGDGTGCRCPRAISYPQFLPNEVAMKP